MVLVSMCEEELYVQFWIEMMMFVCVCFQLGFSCDNTISPYGLFKSPLSPPALYLERCVHTSTV